MPPDKKVYYRKYNVDVFDVLQEHIENISALGTVSVVAFRCAHDIENRCSVAINFVLLVTECLFCCSLIVVPD
jgi:hypothetical protein